MTSLFNGMPIFYSESHNGEEAYFLGWALQSADAVKKVTAHVVWSPWKISFLCVILPRIGRDPKHLEALVLRPLVARHEVP